MPANASTPNAWGPLVWAALVAPLWAAAPEQPEFAAEALHFFESRVRPLLAKHCYECHSHRAEKLKGGLLLDHRQGVLEGGESGPAAIAGTPAESLLVEAIRYESLEMPPQRKLSDDQIATLVRWVEMGLPWPAEAAPSKSRSRTTESEFTVTAEDRDYWAYRPLASPPLPPVTDAAWVANPIDAFVLSQLEGAGLRPNQSATPRELIRRVYFDLIGLPPSPEELRSFVRDPSNTAYRQVIDRLLAHPGYGERWGRYWLDVVRYAQSNGYERDAEKPFAWRYRDYVIRALNEDKPYDRFVKEQLAGDELDDASHESLVATGYYRLGVWDDEPDDRRAAEFDGLDDMLSTTGQVFLGQTIGCARCHNHMFDPISQQDYYELLAFLRNVRYYDKPRYDLESPNFAPLASPASIAAWQRELRTRTEQLIATKEATRDEAERKQIDEMIEKVRTDRGPLPNEWALVVTETSDKPLDTRLLVRGDAGNPGKKVEPKFLAVLGDQQPPLAPRSPHGLSTGRRRALAEWIVSIHNPLTPRVVANRIWQHHFARGIVATPNDLGQAGAPPTHPQLLDWLAFELRSSGWSIKRLHRTIMLSSTYRMSSRAGNVAAHQHDPGNQLMWRQNLRRLDAEALRDAILATAGTLNYQQGGRGFFPQLSGEVLAGQSKPGLGWGVSSEAERSRRSVYCFLKRGVRDPLMETFDYVNTSAPLGQRPVTTVAPQALVLLNSRFMQRQASALATRVEREAGNDPRAQIHRLYWLSLGRSPTDEELCATQEYLRSQRQKLESLDHQIKFVPDVPATLQEGFRVELSPDAYLLGPRSTWGYHTGVWTGGYEAVEVVHDVWRPFALWRGGEFSDCTLTARVKLHHASRSGSLLFRASTIPAKNPSQGETWLGYEVRLDPVRQSVGVYRHDSAGSAPVRLFEHGIQLPTEQWLDMRVALEQQRIRVWLRDIITPLVDITDDVWIVPGRVGVVTAGAAISLDRPKIAAGDRHFNLAARLPNGNSGAESTAATLKHQALTALCLVALNLNEFVYLD